METPTPSVNVSEFLDFVNASPDAFHAVATTSKMLLDAGFIRLQECDSWSLSPGGRYFIIRNGSTIFAFVVGEAFVKGNGFNLVGAHTDSPNLKVKPVSSSSSQGFLSVDVQTYGGGLWHTWFDRDLTISGRVLLQHEEDHKDVKHTLVHIKRPILRVPNLAIHLTSGSERESFKPNKENHLGHPVLATRVKDELNVRGDGDSAHQPALLEAISKELGKDFAKYRICDFELSLSDVQPATTGGVHGEFIFSPRLDNLLMSFTCLKGLLNAACDGVKDESRINLICLYDHEEIGSRSAYGAASNMTEVVLTRILKGLDATGGDLVERSFASTYMISADMAHAVHPCYAEKHHKGHRPMLHKGPVIKYNANQRYATTAVTAFLLKELCRQNDVPIQEFVVRNDSPCGSTIGPIVSAGCGIRTIDIGVPQLSMHSIREMCGTDDVDHAVNLFSAFFRSFTKIDTVPELH